MSYEGYEQHLCSNGHYFHKDAMFMMQEEEQDLCPHCQSPSAWRNPVDETNCNGIGYVQMELLLITPATFQTCNLGHSHCIAEEVYRIPSQEETNSLQTQRWNDAEGTLSLLLHPEKNVGTMWGPK